MTKQLCPIPVANPLAKAARARKTCNKTADILTLVPMQNRSGEQTLSVAKICLQHSCQIAVSKLINYLAETAYTKNLKEIEEMGMSLQESVDVLKSLKCRCGNDKPYSFALCRKCYSRLSPAIKKALYQKIGFGFEQSYDLACKTLDGEK